MADPFFWMEPGTFIKIFFEAFPFTPTRGQRSLAEKVALFLADPDPRSVFVLKGYAGTGKTSFMSSLVRVLPRLGLKAVLLAPTGRAAKVFSAYSGFPAHTIHRRIYFQRMGKEGNIYLTLQKNLYHDAIIMVDEASMIAGDYQESDSAFHSRNLLDDLLQYVGEGQHCRLMLIGDTAQLPPVGMDISPALDLEFLKSRFSARIYHHELTEVMRQSLESGILSNATDLRQMLADERIILPLLHLYGQRDVEKISGPDLEDGLQSAYSSSTDGETIVVCRSNKRANQFNREIRRRILFHEEELGAGDFLMVVRNNYFWLDPEAGPGFIANGDIVSVDHILKIEERYGFRFADVTIRLADYADQPVLDVKVIMDTLMGEGPSLSQSDSKKLFDSVMEDYQDIPQRVKRLEAVRTDPYYNALQVKFAYALTCHKTQGGQWENVFIDPGFIKADQIDREYLRWLYTALTRATKKVFLINFSEKLAE